MLTTLRQALRLVDAWTRRRVAVSVGLALLLALSEMTAFALLYLLIRQVSDDRAEIPAVVGSLLRGLGAQDRSDEVTTLAVLAVVAMTTKSLGAIAIARWQARVQNVAEARLATALFRDYLRRDFLFHVERNSALLIRNLTSSIGQVTTSVVGSLISLTTDALVLLGIFLTVAVAAPGLALGIAAFTGLVLTGYVRVLGPSIERAARQDQELTGITIQAMQEGFSGIKSVHAFDVAQPVADGYATYRSRLADARARLLFVQRLPQYYLEICLVVGAATATIVLVQTVGRDRALALLALVVVAALRVLPSVARILASLNNIRSGSAAVALLGAEARTPAPTPPVSAPGAEPATVVDGSVRFDDVSFRYPGRPADVLAGVSFEVPSGGRVGIVGASGAGKTTVVDVLLGLLQPSSGTVTVGGMRLDPSTRAAWRARVGYVPQETYLLDGTLRDNVLFYRQPSGPDPDADIWAALSAAQLAATVRELPDGLDTAVGERGVRLSGGQRQRLGIARALLLRPSVLVLDEATSALDGATEAAITETLAALRGDITLIVIAHRLSTVQHCDRLVLLEGGRVAATGTLDALASQSAAFAANLGLSGLRPTSDE